MLTHRRRLWIVPSVVLPCLAGCGAEAAPPKLETRLEYRVDFLGSMRTGVAMPELGRVLPETVAVLRRRLVEAGVRGFSVESTGKDRIVVDLPRATDEQLAAWRRAIEPIGSLEMRMVANVDYPGTEFDLAAERQRLRAWLQNADNKRLIDDDPRAIAEFNRRAGTDDGPLSKLLRWAPMARKPNAAGDGWVWVESGGEDDETGHFLPLNLHEPVHFDETDVIRSSFQLIRDPVDNSPAMAYELRAASAARYEELSGRSVGQRLAMIVDGYVVIAPSFRERVPGGRVMVSGQDLDVSEILRHIQRFRAGRLPAMIEFVARKPSPRASKHR